ncbi:sulfate transporter [Ophiocordyceps camponoti-floridani]|uniref:Sulfate transporter n=1 Tax=Ophiocordyceps camponoti-floridani TaxID=2030778 RepID=A0A8H4QCM2_9HYPO|nr:sulfate transporter [Ophiocordyceps camponoti-floridani]
MVLIILIVAMAANRINSIIQHLAPASALSTVQAKHDDDVVITLAIRTPLTKVFKGGFKDTKLESIILALLDEVKKRMGIDPLLVEDIVMGNVSDANAMYKLRAAALAAGFPNTHACYSIDRLCASGLAAATDLARAIACNSVQVGIACGAESLTHSVDHFAKEIDQAAKDIDQAVLARSVEAADSAQPMGWTSENISRELGVDRPDMDEFAAESFRRAEAAQRDGLFDDEIVPVNTRVEGSDGEWEDVTLTRDEGIRPGTTIEGLAKIRPAFPQWGTNTTAGNSSQPMDGAAALLMMKRSTARELGQPILAKYVGSTVAGVAPRIMGIGPTVAIPKLLSQHGLSLAEMDVIEINEAFASMAVYCRDRLGLDWKKMNPRGGAIALGHPLGTTGVRLIVTGLSIAYRVVCLHLIPSRESKNPNGLESILSCTVLAPPCVIVTCRHFAALGQTLENGRGRVGLVHDDDDDDEADDSSSMNGSQHGESPGRRSQTPSSLTDSSGTAAATESMPLVRPAAALPGHLAPRSRHGTFSPRPPSPRDTVASVESGASGADDWKRWLRGRMRTRKMDHSHRLAQQAGFRFTPLMYLAYYVPFFNWIGQYKLQYLQGDFVSALTMASFYLPMALSLASNLSHVPPIHGLYSFVFNPFIYALLGSCPQMVVGPEAAGSLLVGSVVRNSVDSGQGGEDDALLHAQICGVVAGMAGATVLIAGIARLGFLDSVLSRPFLRGFISAVGFVIAVDQLVPELGLNGLADDMGVSHGSSVDKIRFIFGNAHKAHMPTLAISAISFLVIMVCRELKRRLEPRFPSVVFIPDRFLIVAASAILCARLRWDEQGVDILGEVKSATGGLFAFRWPFQLAHMRHIRDAMSTSFLIALLGFFESSVAAKSLGGSDTIQGMELSANREMIALGVANLVGASFMSLPAFGGYGRSKVNKSTGGKSPMSSIFLSLISLLSILFLLPEFYYLPKPVLSSMISVVAWSLIEEAPHDISFFVRIRGWKELLLMAIIFLSTIFYSLALGIALGIGISLLLVIKHSTRPRIQILGRIPGTNRFENAESDQQRGLEFIEGCLIVKIPEPLTFANTGELKARLRRLELYGTGDAHPALPRIRSHESNSNIIFDIHGVTSIDGSGTQVLEEIVRSYRQRGVRVFFSRGPARRSHPTWHLLERSGIVALCGGESHFVMDVEEALRWTEYEESIGRRSVNSNSARD